MNLDFLKDKKVICFAAGIVTAIVGKKIITSEKTRELCVSGLAKGMQMKQDAQEAMKNLKEDAEDLCYEAKNRVNNNAEEADIDEI